MGHINACCGAGSYSTEKPSDGGLPKFDGASSPTCMPCDLGTYSEGGHVDRCTPMACPAGQVATKLGAVHETDGCKPCADGKYLPTDTKAPASFFDCAKITHPDAPSAPTVSEVTAAEATLTWTQPNTHGAEITHHILGTKYALSLRLDAQCALCQVKIEENTRRAPSDTSHPDSAE
jgi:hypothetical protein